MTEGFEHIVFFSRNRLGQVAFRHDKDESPALAFTSEFSGQSFCFSGVSMEKKLSPPYIPVEDIESVTLTYHVKWFV